MKIRKTPAFALALFSLAALLFLVACPTSDEPVHVLNMKIDKDNDSLLTFDSLIVKVYRKDSSFSQEVFHGVLRDPKQVLGLPLDPRVGKEFKVSIVGYKHGKIGVRKEVTILESGDFQSKDVPVQPGKDTINIEPAIPEILAPADTSVAEGDSLRFRIGIRYPLTGPTTLTLKDVLPGAILDTAGRDPGDGYFTWRPNLSQGRAEPYAVTLVYASANRKVEKTIFVKVLNTNQPPKLVTIEDQKVKENETLSFKVEATDPDRDSLTLTASGLPQGAAFSAGSFTWKPTLGQAGNYSVKFKVSDGRDSDLVAALITVGNVDVSPPVAVEITSPAHDTTVNFTPIIILYTVNGTQLQLKYPLKDGKNRVRIDTTILNRVGFDTVWITLDTVPPGKSLVKGASPVRTRTPSWSWSSGGNGSGRYRFRLDNEDLTSALPVTDTTYTPSKDQDQGTHTLYVQERDAAGNWSPSGMRAIRIDTTKPVAPPLTVSPASPTNNPLPTWEWTPVGDDLSGLYRVKLDTNDFRAGAVETKATRFTPDRALKEGVHVLYVQQQDSAGNWSLSGNTSIMVDITPPPKPTLTPSQPSPTNSMRPTWNIISGGGAGFYHAKLDDTNLTQGAKSGAFASFMPDPALGHGVHVLYVQERDSAGNWSAIQSSAIMVDLLPPAAPIFDSIPLSPLNSLQPSWTWKGGGGGMGTYRCKLDDSSFTQTDTLKAALFKPAAPLSEGLHMLYVQERDTAGNWSASTARPLVLSLRKIIGAAGITTNQVFYSSLAFDGTGTPYVAFSDEVNGQRATVMRFKDGSWTPLGTPGFSAGGMEYISMAIGASGIPYVSFQDKANGYKASVMRFASGAWEYVGGFPAFSDGGTSYNVIALNKTGIPYVAFMDDANGGKLTVMRLLGATWTPVGKAGFSDGYAQNISLALSNAGIPYVAFNDKANGIAVTVMRLIPSSGAWEKVGGGIPVPGGLQPRIAINSMDEPYLAVDDGTLKLLRYRNANWETIGNLSTMAASSDPGPVLALSADDVPYLAFADLKKNNKLTVMRYTSSRWEYVGGAGISTDIALYLSLAIHPSGVPFVSFQDWGNEKKLTVMKSSFDP